MLRRRAGEAGKEGAEDLEGVCVGMPREIGSGKACAGSSRAAQDVLAIS